MKKIIKLISLAVVAVLVILMVGCGGGDTGTNKRTTYLKMGTAGTGGAYYPIGSAMADIISKHVDGVQCTAEITGGAVENPRLVHQGEVELAMTNADTLYLAYNGEGTYTEKFKIAPMFTTTPSVIQFVTTNSNINTFADLKDKKICIGPMGGGAAKIFAAVAPIYGFTIDDIRASYISFSEGIQELNDGNLDAVMVQAALPSSAIMELISNGKPWKIINFEEEKLAEIRAKYPYYTSWKISKDMYQGMTEDIMTLSVNNVAICDKDMDADLVYSIVKAVYENLDQLRGAHTSTSAMKIEDGWDTPVPLHPGAEKYFKEKGVMK